MEMMVWNIVLTAALGLVTWFAKTMWAEQQRLSILLNRTREEVAKEYVTKAEVHTDINRVLDRLEALDTKLDRFLENRAVGM
jgi:predicted O-methyltransferase YrrM